MYTRVEISFKYIGGAISKDPIPAFGLVPRPKAGTLDPVQGQASNYNEKINKFKLILNILNDYFCL